MKIGIKLILGFLVVALLIAVVGYISVSKSQAALREVKGEDAINLAASTILEIDKIIYIRVEELQIYANDLYLAREAINSNKQFDSIVDVQSYIDSIDKDWKDKKETQFIQSVLNNELSKMLSEHLEFYRQEYGYAVIAEMYVTNEHGVIIGSSGRTSDYWQADEEWYQKTINEKEFWVGDLEYDESSNSFALDLVINLYDDNGNIVGVLKGVLNIEDIKNTINEIQANSHHKSILPYLVDKNGIVIFTGLDPSQKELGRDIRLEEFGRDISSREAVAQAIKGNNDFIISKQRGQKGDVLTAFSHSNGFRDFNGLGWSVLIDFETDEIFGSIVALKNILLFVSVITIIIALLIGLFISRSISKPIIKLRDATEEMSKGNLSVKVDIKTRDELEDLGNTFNIMLEDLAKSRSKLKYFTQKQKVTGLYITLNKGYKTIIDTLKGQGVDTSRLYFIDGISQKEGNETKGNCTFIPSPEWLTDLSLAITTAINTGKFNFLFLDSLNTILAYNNPKKTEKFIHYIISNIRKKNVGGIIFSVEDVSTKKLIPFLSQFCDYIDVK